MARHVIVVPCYNEEKRLKTDAFLAYARAHNDIGLLFVDDGSTDGTKGVLEAMQAEAPDRIDVLILEQNGGKAEAVRRGVLHATQQDIESFGYWDADLSTGLDEIEPFLEILTSRAELMLVMGSRVKLLGRRIDRKAMRHYLGRVFATCASMVLDLPVYDTQCGAKLFRNTPATRGAFEEPFISSWIFDVELLARLGKVGRSDATYDTHRCVYEKPLLAWIDVAGSKIKLRDWVKAAGELVRIGWRYR